jgi:hypothetical protein
MKILFVIFFGLFLAHSAFSQDEKIKMKARHYKDSVVLRWAPLNPLEWAQMNRYGYRIERYEINETTKGKINPKKLGPDTLKPLSLETWKSTFPIDHPYAPIAVQALYGKNFEVSSSSEVDQLKAKSQEALLRHSFALLMADIDAPTAMGLALRYCDKSLPTTGAVQYRLISLHPTMKDTIEYGIRIEDPIDEVPLPPMIESESGDKSVKMRWEIELQNPKFTAYWLERSLDNGTSWRRTSKQPILKADHQSAVEKERYIYIDDTLISENYKPIWYRLQGITSFAELSQYSPIVIAMGTDKNAPPPPIMKEPKDIGEKMQVIWEYPDIPTDFKEFRIGKSSLINGPFVPIENITLPVSARTWTDNNFDALGENYYVVYAIDTSGNTSVSLPAYGFLKDSIPPSKPVRPSGSIDTNGVVRLHWKLGPEKDILGYRVYFANAIDHEFSILTPKPNQDTAFTDTITLNTLSKKIYYKIVAVDRNYNHSSVSEILTLVKPDILPPVEPLFSNFKVSDNSVDLSFIPSSSKDVQTHEIYRAEAGTSNWVKIFSWRKPEIISTYSDKSVKGGTYYQYTILAIDSSGNKSKRSPTVDVRVIPKVSREALSSPQATFNAEKKSIDLSWKKPVAPVKHYVIYRGKSGKRPSSLISVEGNLTNFSDTSMTGKGTYRYMIRAIYADGGESPFLYFQEVEVK